MKIGKGETKLSLFTENKVVYIEVRKKSIKGKS